MGNWTAQEERMKQTAAATATTTATTTTTTSDAVMVELYQGTSNAMVTGSARMAPMSSIAPTKCWLAPTKASAAPLESVSPLSTVVMVSVIAGMEVMRHVAAPPTARAQRNTGAAATTACNGRGRGDQGATAKG